MLKNYLKILKQKKGMSLVEVLTAMTILTLMIFCFAPLFLSYFQSIDIAGDKIEQVNYESGILQRVIGNFNKEVQSDSSGYISDFQNIPLTLTSSAVNLTTRAEDTHTTVNGKDVLTVAKPVSSTTSLVNKTVITKAYGGTLKDIEGSFLVSNPDSMASGFATLYSDDIDAGFFCFPNSITDDFIKKDIFVVADGMGATEDSIKLYINVDSSSGLDSTIYGTDSHGVYLKKGVSWGIREIAVEGHTCFVVTFYGGKGISFETSPVTIYCNGYTKTVEVDAPMMIMVGEANKNGQYNYYVSRGEVVDPDYTGTGTRTPDTLAVLQRTMKGDTPLTSAMNDVEWVDAESADDYTNGAKIDGTKYGYYVMCGDNGQIRRFWREKDKLKDDGKVDYGNYYWGGDWTYYTDYNLNRFSGANTYINTTDASGTASTDKVYSTDVSFKFIAMRPMQWESGKVPADGIISTDDATDDSNKFRTGFNMSSKRYKVLGATVGIAHLRNLCTVSATYGDQIQFYGTDGQIYLYIGKQARTGSLFSGYTYWGPEDDDEGMPSLTDIKAWEKKSESDGLTYQSHPVWGGLASSETAPYYNTSHEAWGWLDPGDGTDSYYDIYGIDTSAVNKASYPITLTSVDAIRLSGSGAYETDVKDTGKSNYFVSGVLAGMETSGDATSDTNASGTLSTSTNLSYPTSNYVLYCGYIPAYMDAWAGYSGATVRYPYSTGWKEQFSNDSGGSFNTLVSNIGRASNRQNLDNNTTYYTLWRMTMGITPFYNGTSLNTSATGQLAYMRSYGLGYTTGKYAEHVVYYPYTNLEYAVTGKFYDNYTYNNTDAVDDLFADKTIGGQTVTAADPSLLISPVNTLQNNVTQGKIVDVTIAYLSDPLAVSLAANPTDHVVYDLANNKSTGQVFYWHNRREAITFLDSASTVVPNGENDVPVSLMVGYVLGGTVLYGTEGSSASVDITSVMNNGIVFLRAGNSEIDRQGNKSDAIAELLSEDAANSKTSEFMAIDADGYMLAEESNVFHQFYYLNSRNSDVEKPSKGSSIGNLYGAAYWQNNRHILNRSITGGTPSSGSDGSYEYLRAHPMTDTQVTCVAWGVTWNGNPEAMWGTDNGTVLSWWVDVDAATNDAGANSSNYNDSQVAAEIQSYQWIDRCSGKVYAATDKNDTVGSAGTSYHYGADKTIASVFSTFFDKGTQATSSYGTLGFINTLENINDIEYADDYWVAVGDQSDVDPYYYCANGEMSQSDAGLKANDAHKVIKPYSNEGSGSWVNVRYWVDLVEDGSNKQSDSNSTYHWRAVRVTTEEDCNIVQINNVNGMWIATGYKDDNKNDEYDTGEEPRVFWTYDPLTPCGVLDDNGVETGWSSKVEFYKEGATSETEDNTIDKSLIGGINSCATRS